jgi:hypothetical protein
MIINKNKKNGDLYSRSECRDSDPISILYFIRL